MKMFGDRLYDAVEKTNSRICMGLDPVWDRIPSELKENALGKFGETPLAAEYAIVNFNKKLIDIAKGRIACIKPQSAYYEAWGSVGFRALEKTVAYAKEQNVLVIVDSKRGDIGSTSCAYAAAGLGSSKIGSSQVSPLSADAMTVNPYFGTDGVQPFIDEAKSENAGLYLLVKTSNPTSAELQDLLVSGKPLYSSVAALVVKWGKELIGNSGYSSIGAVVGATHPEELKTLREQMKSTPLLIPGYGAQGGTAQDIASAFIGGQGAVVNSSRGLNYAWTTANYKDKFSEKEWSESVSIAIDDMNADINAVI